MSFTSNQENFNSSNQQRMSTNTDSSHGYEKCNMKQVFEKNQTPDQNSALKKREQFAISLRKNKHQQVLQSKRRENMQSMFQRTQEVIKSGSQFQDFTSQDFIPINDESTLIQMIEFLNQAHSRFQENQLQRLKVVRSIRLGITNERTSDHIIYYFEKNRNHMGTFLDMIKDGDVDLEIKSEAMWSLCTLACENKLSNYIATDLNILEHLKDLLHYHFIDNFQVLGQVERQNLLTSQEASLLEQTLWTISNIILDSAKVRVHALDIGIDYSIGVIIHSYGQQFNDQIWRVVIWLLSGLSTGLAYMTTTHHDVFNQFLAVNLNRAYKMIMETFNKISIEKEKSNKIIQLKEDIAVIVDCISRDCEDSQIELVAKMEHVRSLMMSFITDKNPRYFVHCAKYVGDISAVDETQASYFINSGILEEFDVYMSFCSKSDKINIIWVLSNFAANSPRDAERVAASTIIHKLILFLNDKNYDIRKESIWTICNICQSIEDDHVIDLVINSGIIQSSIDLFIHDKDSGLILYLTMKALQFLFTKSPRSKIIFINFGGVSMLVDMQICDYIEVYKIASEIIEQHFNGEEIDHQEALKMFQEKESAVFKLD